MFLNDPNPKKKDVALSPLKYDVSGRFSRKGTPGFIAKPHYNIHLIESILITLFISFLLATDFILFAGSGNVKVFENSIFPIPEVSFILVAILLFVSIFVFLIRKLKFIKYLMAAIFALGFVYISFQQFSQFQQTINFLGYDIPLYIILEIFLSGLTLVVFIQKRLLYKIMIAVASLVLFMHVYLAYMIPTDKHEFLESHNTQKITDTKPKRFIYLMFPNLVSYPYLSTISGEGVDKTKSIMNGFYQKNNFKLYPKAYGESNNYLGNMITSFNPTSSKSEMDHILTTKVLSGYWQFYNLRNEYIYLKDNELYDIFHKYKFQISAYKTRDFDMCHKKHKFNVNRCIEKINRPINLYSTSLSMREKISILAIEWLSSMHLFDDMTSVYNLLKPFINMDKMPMIGTNYNNLYIVNSIKTFDVLLENIKKDSGKQAYFAFIDLPSDMYIYDEYCQIKPRDKWLNMVNLPWIERDYTSERQQAYLEQTRCLFGKLEQFIDNLKKDNLWEDSFMVIQGVSGVNDFKNYPLEGITQDFLANHSVNMAIHDHHMTASQIDNKMCSTSAILAEYLFHTKHCQNIKANVHESILNDINKRLSLFSVDLSVNSIETFSSWYKEWSKANGYNIFDENIIIKSDKPTKEDFGIDDLDLIMNEFEVNNEVFTK